MDGNTVNLPKKVAKNGNFLPPTQDIVVDLVPWHYTMSALYYILIMVVDAILLRVIMNYETRS